MKRVVKFSSWEGRLVNDLAYRLSIPPMHRFAAIQVLRQQLHLTKPSQKSDGKWFENFLELLNRHSLAYLVIGGFAVGYHGYPRYVRFN